MKKAKSKKKMPKEISASLVTLVVILITLGVMLPLHFIYPHKLTAYWVIAICVAVISPFALANFKIYAEAKGNYTEEQKKAASGKIGLAMLTVWYVDFTFVCMFMDWLVAFFVLAGLYLIKMVYDVAKVLINRKESTVYPNFVVVGDFVLCFLLMILLIYKIPDQQLQTIVLALVAALLGGLLTLLGVMMTIKKSDMDREEEERKRAKPVFAFNMLTKEPVRPEFDKACFPMEEEESGYPCEAYVEVENSNLSSFAMKRIKHDGKWFELEGNTTLIPGNKCVLSFRFESPFNLFLEAEDSLEIAHFYSMKVLNFPIKTTSGRSFHTLREIKEISAAEAEQSLEEAKKDA